MPSEHVSTHVTVLKIFCRSDFVRAGYMLVDLSKSLVKEHMIRINIQASNVLRGSFPVQLNVRSPCYSRDRVQHGSFLALGCTLAAIAADPNHGGHLSKLCPQSVG